MRRVRSIIGGSIGNLVEWYDWYVYSAFSLYFAKAFFPAGDQTAQLLNTAAVFAVGFLMRPIGSWLLGRYADRHGRKAALTASVLLMCAGSLIIALTPSYAAIGTAAPVLLVLARLLQGLSVGGEYGASATYMSEIATRERRGFYASFQYVTLIAGQMVALGVLIVMQQWLLTEDQLESWGWRIPFAIGAACAVVALYLRRGIDETESFLNRKHQERDGLVSTLLAHPKPVLLVLGLTMGGSLSFYTYTTYMQKFLVNTAGWTKSDATSISAATLFIFMLLQPAFGALSDRFGRRALLIAFGLPGMVMTYPLMTTLATTSDLMTAFWLILAALMVLSCYTSISGLIKAELFPTEVRALGVGLPYAIGVSLFGGTAEYVALWFKSIGQEAGFYYYVSACVGIALLCALLMPDTRRHSAIREG